MGEIVLWLSSLNNIPKSEEEKIDECDARSDDKSRPNADHLRIIPLQN